MTHEEALISQKQNANGLIATLLALNAYSTNEQITPEKIFSILSQWSYPITMDDITEFANNSSIHRTVSEKNGKLISMGFDHGWAKEFERLLHS